VPATEGGNCALIRSAWPSAQAERKTVRLRTLGRAIHSSRSVGSTGGIAGVAVFHRALNATELAHLALLSHGPLLSRSTR
jgi:hypothetical protein